MSDKLLDIYEQDGMNLKQLMAFSISDDHARHEQVWDIVSQSHNREPAYCPDRTAAYLVRDVYWQTPGADCLEAYVREIPLPVHSPDMPGSVPAQRGLEA